MSVFECGTASFDTDFVFMQRNSVANKTFIIIAWFMYLDDVWPTIINLYTIMKQFDASNVCFRVPKARIGRLKTVFVGIELKPFIDYIVMMRDPGCVRLHCHFVLDSIFVCLLMSFFPLPARYWRCCLRFPAASVWPIKTTENNTSAVSREYWFVHSSGNWRRWR